MDAQIQVQHASISRAQPSAMSRARLLIREKARNLARLICWRTLEPRITLSSGITVTLKSESDWEIANEVFLRHDYDDPIDRAFLCQDGTEPIRVLDLGANVGFFSLRCIDRYAGAPRQSHSLELFAVEGSPSVSAELEKSLSIYRGSAGISVNVTQGLIGRRSGKGMIYSSLFHSCTNTVVPHGGKTSKNILLGRHAEGSKYLDLDELIPAPRPVDLIKCDIEGSELEFLQNYESLLRRARLLVIELHPLQCDVSACREILSAYGFRKERTIKCLPTHSLEVYGR